MNRNAGKKLWKCPGESEHNIVRHEHGAEIFPRRPIRVVDTFVREKNHRIHRRFTDELRQMLGVDRFEIALERAGGNAELAQHETRQPSVPAFQPQPAARTGAPIAHHVDMHVNPLALRWDTRIHQRGSVAFTRR
jgi:hypothetical protein